MINLSEMVLSDPKTSTLYKLRVCLRPNVYLADNIQDFISDHDSLPKPSLVKSLLTSQSVLIIFHNVSLTQIPGQKEFFAFSDSSTGRMVVIWSSNNPVCSAMQGPEQLKEEGWRDGEASYSVILRYFLEDGMRCVISVQRKPESQKRQRIKDTVRCLFPLPEELLEPV